MKSLVVILMIFLMLPVAAPAQDTCAANKIYGEWKCVSAGVGRYNIDSLKNNISGMRDTIGIWSFNPDGTYTYRSTRPKINYRAKGVYRIDIDRCQLILGTKRNAAVNNNLEIIYLDDKHMIYKSDNNPPGANHTYFLTR